MWPWSVLLLMLLVFFDELLALGQLLVQRGDLLGQFRPLLVRQGLELLGAHLLGVLYAQLPQFSIRLVPFALLHLERADDLVAGALERLDALLDPLQALLRDFLGRLSQHGTGLWLEFRH